MDETMNSSMNEFWTRSTSSYLLPWITKEFPVRISPQENRYKIIKVTVKPVVRLSTTFKYCHALLMF